MAKKPEAALTPQTPAGRLAFDQVVNVEDDSISGTRDTPLPLKIATLPSEGASGVSAFAAQPPPQVSNAIMEGVVVSPSAGESPEANPHFIGRFTAPAHNRFLDLGQEPEANLTANARTAPSEMIRVEAYGSAAFSGTSSLRADAIVVTNSERLHAEMLRRIEALEKTMANVATPHLRGIGHNNPPEPLEAELLSEAELRGVRLAFAVLKTQQSAPNVPSDEAVDAVGLVAAIAERLKPFASYLTKQADTFVTEATKELAKRAIQSPFWAALIEQLPQLADAAQSWLRSLGAH